VSAPLVTLLYVGWLALHTITHGSRDHCAAYGMLVLVLLLAQVTLGIINVLAPLAAGHRCGNTMPWPRC